MAPDISTMLLKALGGKDNSIPPNEESLPDTLKKLTETIAKAMTARANTSQKEMAAADRRGHDLDMLFRQYQADLKETARIFKALNETESNSLKLAEKEAKDGAAYRKRMEAASRRADRMSEVSGRQSGAAQGNWLGLIGAIGGTGLKDLVGNFIKAGDQTKADIAKVSEARYDDLLAGAAAEKENRIAGADKGLADARAAYAESMKAATEREGAAVMQLMEGDRALAATEKAADELKAAKANQRNVAAEGLSRMQEAERGDTAVPGKDAVSEIARPLGDIAAAIREGTDKGAGIILDAETRNAVQAGKVSKVAEEVAARNLEADAAVARAGDAYVAASANDQRSLATYASGMAEGEGALRDRQAAAERLAIAETAAVDARAEAIRGEETAVASAFERKQAGSLVGESEKSAIGSSNMMNMAVAPPAVVLIGKVMDQFRGLFPVIEQTGNALIEMGTALPAGLIAMGMEGFSKVVYQLAMIKESIRGARSEVSKRYVESNKAVVGATTRSRGELYGAAIAGRVESAKDRSASLASSKSYFVAGASRVTANAPAQYTVGEMNGGSAGIVGNAGTSAEARKQYAQAPAPAAPESREQSIGVVPVGASNRNIDEWR